MVVDLGECVSSPDEPRVDLTGVADGKKQYYLECGAFDQMIG